MSIDPNTITDDEVCGFMNPPPFDNQQDYLIFWLDFANYLASCKRKRSNYIEACLRKDLGDREHALPTLPDCLFP